MSAKRIAWTDREPDGAAALWKVQFREKAADVLHIELFRRYVLGRIDAPPDERLHAVSASLLKRHLVIIRAWSISCGQDRRKLDGCHQMLHPLAIPCILFRKHRNLRPRGEFRHRHGLDATLKVERS